MIADYRTSREPLTSDDGEVQRLREQVALLQRERELIACEIHDRISQYLSAAMMSMGRFELLRTRDPDQAESAWRTAREMLDRGASETRRLMQGLGPSVPCGEGLVAGLGQLIDEIDRRDERTIELIHDLGEEPIAAPLATAAFQIVREALLNACRHSRSPRIRVEIARRGDRLELGVQDWGVGFQPDADQRGRFGLRGIRRRAEAFGGTAEIASEPGQGTQVRVDLPLG